jgi:CheY-like chemotaxis protein
VVQARPILLVEDGEDDIELIQGCFRRAEITAETVVVRDGREALDYLFGKRAFAARDLSVNPAVIFLDLKLPKLNGFEVLSEIRRHHSTRCVPVVVLSSSSEIEDIKRAYEEGANSYVRKQASFKKFSESVQIAARYWTSVNECPYESPEDHPGTAYQAALHRTSLTPAALDGAEPPRLTD